MNRNMINPLLVLALLVGSLLPFQAGINATLRRCLTEPTQAALISFTVGTIGLLVYCIVMQADLPSPAALADAPWWAWIGGGLCGAVYISLVIFLAPKLGTGTTFSLIVAGQMIMAMVLDHFGFLGFQTHPVTLLRLIGAALLVSGVFLIQKF